MKRKALFFDVDGTLLSEKTHTVPKSAVEAIKEARARGHLVFINSGRVYCHLNQIRKEIESDGFLCGCGTYVEAEGEILHAVSIPRDRGIQIKKDIDKYGMLAILESVKGCYMQNPPYRNERADYFRNGLTKSQVLLPVSWDQNDYEFDKFCLLGDKNSDRDAFFMTLKPDIQVIDRGDDFYECVPNGYSKATAIDVILKKYDLGLEDVYVFGDSMNDFPMFEYAHHAILMGKHDHRLEPYASLITKTVEEDGIELAMIQLGIIG